MIISIQSVFTFLEVTTEGQGGIPVYLLSSTCLANRGSWLSHTNTIRALPIISRRLKCWYTQILRFHSHPPRFGCLLLGLQREITLEENSEWTVRSQCIDFSKRAQEVHTRRQFRMIRFEFLGNHHSHASICDCG